MDTGPGPAQRIAAQLRERIVTGALVAGDRVPSTRALAAEHGVASATAARALGLLRDDGWTRTVPRVGSVVAERSPVPPATADGGPDRGVVVAAAVAIADTEGIAALSMRRVAVVLGRSTMSLYRVVRGRDDLVLGMIESALTEVGWPTGSGAWRSRLETVARRQWAVHRRHPWLARVLSLSRPQAVPALLRLAEAELTALELVVDDPVTRFDLHLALTSYVRGMAIDLAAEVEAVLDSGLDADTWAARDAGVREHLRRHAGPALHRLGSYPYDLDRIFDVGLATLLDGIEHRYAPASP